jgi:uncharacterized protein (TIGR03067 family)
MRIVMLLLAVSLVGCGKTEETKPHGTWIGQTAGLAGPGSFKETWTFKDGTITVEDDGPQYSYEVDATKEPKEIDITVHVPGRGKKVRIGIYKIENDTLTICATVPGRGKPDATRPKEFYPTERDDVMPVTFRRKK